MNPPAPASGESSVPAGRPGRGRRGAFLAVTAIVSLALTFGLLEAALRYAEGRESPEEALTIPEEWALEHVEVEGAEVAYRWHGHLHVHNRDRMRTAGRYPPKPAQRFRILALGDSLTYGYGVAAEHAWPARLDEALGPDIEVLNLGVSGYQSEDIAELARQQFEKTECVKVRGLDEDLAGIAPPIEGQLCHRFELDPDLIVYGVCLNDFLPRKIGQGTRTQDWAIPFPHKEWFMEHTLLGPFLAERYATLLVRLGLRVDFWEDVRAGGERYQRRFAADVERMNEVVMRHGLPPVVGLVLTQFPGRYPELVEAAERAIEGAGFTVVPSADYVERHAGAELGVSRWEAHPNEQAHAIFGEEIAAVLREHPTVAPYLQD